MTELGNLDDILGRVTREYIGGMDVIAINGCPVIEVRPVPVERTGSRINALMQYHIIPPAAKKPAAKRKHRAKQTPTKFTKAQIASALVKTRGVSVCSSCTFPWISDCSSVQANDLG